MILAVCLVVKRGEKVIGLTLVGRVNDTPGYDKQTYQLLAHGFAPCPHS